MKQETGKSRWPERAEMEHEEKEESGAEEEAKEKKEEEKKKQAMRCLTPAILARRVILFITRT